MKQCTNCGSDGPFYRDNSTKDGLTYNCAECIKLRTSAWNIENIERYNRRRELWFAANPTKVKTYLRRHIAKDPKAYSKKRAAYCRKSRLKTRYGLTENGWEALFESQGRKCAICGIDVPTSRGWATDHDHENGKHRGILCAPHNAALGAFGDSPEMLRMAADYIEGWRAQHAASRISDVGSGV